MIKRKGVCDVCNSEFELDKGSFGIRIVEDSSGDSSRKWTVNVMSCMDGCLEAGYSHVCGMACLYRAMSEAIDKKTKEPDLRIVGYEGEDDANTHIIDLRDKKPK